MAEKYTMLDTDTIKVAGKTLYRIKALISFPNVLSGETGGYIQSKDNLANEGNCWVGDNAKVYGKAKVYGDAEVFGNARVMDSAKVYGKAKVFGDAEVSGMAEVCDNAHVSDYARVLDEVMISGTAVISQKAEVYGSAGVDKQAHVYGDARVHGNARVTDKAKVFGMARVYGKAVVSGNAVVKDKMELYEAVSRKAVSAIHSILEGLESKKNMINEGTTITFKGMKLLHVKEYSKDPNKEGVLGSEIYKLSREDLKKLEDLMEAEKLYIGTHHIWKLDGKSVINLNKGLYEFKG